MLPLIIGGLAGTIAGVVGAAYRHWSSDKRGFKSLGSVVIWGRPNTGKTTFIARLRGEDPNPGHKEATTSKKKYTEILLTDLDGGPFRIEEIVDMPGNMDRLEDWLRQVVSSQHVFYLIDLSRVGDRHYKAAVRSDIKATVKALCDSTKPTKRINLIASHLDQSEWRREDPAEVNNKNCCKTMAFGCYTRQWTALTAMCIRRI